MGIFIIILRAAFGRFLRMQHINAQNLFGILILTAADSRQINI